MKFFSLIAFIIACCPINSWSQDVSPIDASPDQLGIANVYIGSLDQRKVTILNNDLVLAVFEVPSGVILNLQISQKLNPMSSVEKNTFHGDILIRLRKEKDGPLQETMKDAPLELAVKDAKVMVETITVGDGEQLKK